MPSPEAKKTGRRAYLTARLLALIGLVFVAGALAFAFYNTIAKPTAASLKRITLPGTTGLSLEKAGLYNLYYDHLWTEPPRELQLSVREKKTGKEVAVKESAATPESKWRDPDNYKIFATFKIDEPGDYEMLALSYSRQSGTGGIFVGANYQPKSAFPPGAIIGGFFVILIGRFIASITFSRRRREVEAEGESLIYQEKGISVYSNFIFLKRVFSATELHKDQINYIEQAKKAGRGGEAETAPGIEINYNRAGQERARFFRSKTALKLYQALKSAGYRTKGEPAEGGEG